jgi:hypothetical protein
MVMDTNTAMNMAPRQTRRDPNVGQSRRRYWLSRRTAAVGLATLVVVVPVTQVTMSLLQTAGRPDTAAKLWPYNSLALARLAGDAATSGQSAANIASAGANARRALMLEPGNVIAARALGIIAGLNGDEPGMVRALTYSETLSRRDRPTQLGLIELSVQKEDITGALRHYNRALRTSKSLPILLSTMISASSDPEILSGVVKLLRDRPVWRSAFLVQMVDEQTPPDTVLGFLRALRLDPADAFERQILSRAVGKLVGQDRVADVVALLPKTPGLIRNGGFENENMFPPLDWALVDDANLNGVIEAGPAGRGQVLYAEAHNGRGGKVAEEVVSLSQGKYRITFVAGDVTSGAAPKITLNCGNDDTRILASVMPSVTGPAGKIVASQVFSVRPNCSVQRIKVIMQGSIEGDTPRPWIDNVAILSARS